MSYAFRAKQFGPLGTGAVMSLTAVATHTFSYYCERQCSIERIAARVTTSVVSSAPVALQVSIIHADGSGTVALPTILVPGGTAAGQVVYKNVPVPSVPSLTIPTMGSGVQVDNFGSLPNEFLVYPGDQVTFAVSTAAAGGGAAGAVYFLVDASDSPEAPVLHANMIASA